MGISNVNVDYAGECDPSNNGSSRRISELPSIAGINIPLSKTISLLKWVGHVGKTAVVQVLSGDELTIPFKTIIDSKAPIVTLDYLTTFDESLKLDIDISDIFRGNSEYELDYIHVSIGNRTLSVGILDIQHFIIKPKVKKIVQSSISGAHGGLTSPGNVIVANTEQIRLHLFRGITNEVYRFGGLAESDTISISRNDVTRYPAFNLYDIIDVNNTSREYLTILGSNQVEYFILAERYPDWVLRGVIEDSQSDVGLTLLLSPRALR
jgi:hypothetical protein